MVFVKWYQRYFLSRTHVTYQEFSHSQLLPELNIGLLVYCVQIPSRLEAMKAFREGITP